MLNIVLTLSLLGLAPVAALPAGAGAEPRGIDTRSRPLLDPAERPLGVVHGTELDANVDRWEDRRWPPAGSRRLPAGTAGRVIADRASLAVAIAPDSTGRSAMRHGDATLVIVPRIASEGEMDQEAPPPDRAWPRLRRTSMDRHRLASPDHAPTVAGPRLARAGASPPAPTAGSITLITGCVVLVLLAGGVLRRL
jgi:hypothetical protein